MSMLELTLNQLAELATAELTDVKNPYGLPENRKVAKESGNIAGNARKEIESQTGRPVVTSKTAADLGFVMNGLLSSANEFPESEE